MHIIFRVDGGPEIGYGHLIRSGALIETIADRGHTVTVATTTPKPAQSVLPDNITTVCLPVRDDPSPFVAWLETTTIDIAFTDAYPVDTAYQRAIWDYVPLVVLQDDARHAVCADVFVNGNLYAADLSYEFVDQKPVLCLGMDYVLLRRAVRKQAVDDPPWREIPNRAIVTMGGSDSAKLTPTILKAFEGFDVAVEAVVGPGFSAEQEREVRQVAANISNTVRITRDPDNLVAIMHNADFAVSTASSTTYELLALGTPMVSIPVADNQEQIATTLQELNLAIVLERNTNREAIKSAIQTYMTTPKLRQTRREQGRSLVDTKGTIRIERELYNIA